MSSFVNQTLLTITLETGVNVSTASVKKILYRKPNGATGTWNATAGGVGNTQLTYQMATGAGNGIDIAGEWRFQAYYVIGGNGGYGDYFYSEFLTPLPNV